MKLFIEPIIDKGVDGTCFTMVHRVTPQLIDDRIRRLNGFKKAKFDLEKIVSIIRGSSSEQDAEDALRKTFRLTAPQANFVLEASFEDLPLYCNREKWEAEISRWMALKELIKDDPFNYNALEWDE